MLDSKIPMSIAHQCRLLTIHRSGFYYTPLPEKEENLLLMRMMAEQYLRTPFYGIRRMREWLLTQGYRVNRKRVKRLMELMRWQNSYNKRNLSKHSKERLDYRYRLI